MAPAEWRMFEAFLGCARNYVEWGSGASTVLAADLVKVTVTSFDSSQAWLDRVAADCRSRGTRLTPRLALLDIGETGAWGFPVGEAARARWPDYHGGPWTDPHCAAGDFYLVDGRFRVACFIQALLHAGNDAFIAFHDYASRPHYHAADELADEVARLDDLSIFRRRPDLDRETAARLLAAHAHDPR